MEKYDKIGIDYNRTRKADPYLAERLLFHLQARKGGLYLDIGCGTGNYTVTLHKKGFRLIGIDPSEEMLDKARKRNSDISWRRGAAESTGLENESIDGVIATLTIHHWPDLAKGFREISRVLKPGGRIVIFTSTPEQTGGYWLKHYFPQMLADSAIQMPSLEKITDSLQELRIVETEKYFVSPALKDLFLYSGKHRPELYLDPQVRQGISSFSSLANRAEVEAGLKKLETDITTGEITRVINSHANETGDYLFLILEKS